MKKKTTIVTLISLVAIGAVVCCFAYLSGKARHTGAEPEMSAVQKVLSRDMQNDYPSTVKEVAKYYTEIQRCLYNDEYTDEEFEQLGRRSRELYDEDLLKINEEEFQLSQLNSEVQAFRSRECQLVSISVAPSTNVDYFEEDGYSFARILCRYTVREDGSPGESQIIYLMRKDKNRHWKIYGWDQAGNVNPVPSIE